MGSNSSRMSARLGTSSPTDFLFGSRPASRGSIMSGFDSCSLIILFMIRLCTTFIDRICILYAYSIYRFIFLLRDIFFFLFQFTFLVDVSLFPVSSGPVPYNALNPNLVATIRQLEEAEVFSTINRDS